MSTSIQDISLTTIDGQPSSLADYQGKVLLLVNVASKCGLTPQYEGLQALYAEKHAQGLEVLGFPANNFLGQEPGSEAEIQQFCQLTYDVSFPMFSKISVAGDDTHPLYQQLTAAQPQSIGEGRCASAWPARRFRSTPRRRCCGTSRSSWSAATARSSPASPRTWRLTTRACAKPSKPRWLPDRPGSDPFPRERAPTPPTAPKKTPPRRGFSCVAERTQCVHCGIGIASTGIGELASSWPRSRLLRRSFSIW